MGFFKTVSCQTIVAKIARTFKPSDSTWIVDCIEDIGWAIQAIGYHASFTKKTTELPYLTVKNHRATIPCDVERILGVEALTFVSTSENLLNPDGTNRQVTPEDCPIYKGIPMTLSSDIGHSSIGETSPRTTQMQVEMLLNTYSINGDYVVTGFEEGLIKLLYIGFNIDKEGYPKVIDEFHYKEALTYYCLTAMMHRGFKPSSNIDWREADAKFQTHAYAASNAAKMMGLDEARRFDASINRYAKSANFSGNSFAGLEQQEFIDR